MISATTRHLGHLAIACLLVGVGSSLPSAQSPGATDWNEGLRLYAAEEYRKAQGAFERALGEDPTNATYKLWLGRAIGRRANQMTGLRRLQAAPLAKQVRQAFQEAVELDGTNLDALEALHRFHLEAPGFVGGQKDEARRLAGEIERLDSARGAHAWGACFEQAEDFARAEEKYGLARQLEPANIGYQLTYAGFLARRGKVQPSDALFEDALSREPENPDVWLAAAKAWVQAKRRSYYSRARQLLERYLASPNRRLDSEPASQVRRLLRGL